MKIFDPNYWEEASAIQLETHIAKVLFCVLFQSLYHKVNEEEETFPLTSCYNFSNKLVGMQKTPAYIANI